MEENNEKTEEKDDGGEEDRQKKPLGEREGEREIRRDVMGWNNVPRQVQ